MGQPEVRGRRSGRPKRCWLSSGHVAPGKDTPREGVRRFTSHTQPERPAPTLPASPGHPPHELSDGSVLLGDPVESAGDVGHEDGAIFLLCQTTNQNDENERSWGIHDGCIMMELVELPGLVGNQGACR